MCEPTTIVSIGMAIASTATSMMAQKQQAKAATAQANYQAAVENNNAKIAEYRAEDAKQRGEIEERQHRLKVEQLKGRQRSVLSSSGFAVDQEDAIGILQDTAQMGEFDALTIRHNSEVEAYNHRVTGMNHEAQVGLFQGKAAAQDPTLGMAGTLFSGAASVADKWYKYKAG